MVHRGELRVLHARPVARAAASSEALGARDAHAPPSSIADEEDAAPARGGAPFVSKRGKDSHNFVLAPKRVCLAVRPAPGSENAAHAANQGATAPACAPAARADADWQAMRDGAPSSDVEFAYRFPGDALAGGTVWAGRHARNLHGPLFSFSDDSSQPACVVDTPARQAATLTNASADLWNGGNKGAMDPMENPFDCGPCDAAVDTSRLSESWSDGCLQDLLSSVQDAPDAAQCLARGFARRPSLDAAAARTARLDALCPPLAGALCGTESLQMTPRAGGESVRASPPHQPSSPPPPLYAEFALL